MLKIMKNNKKIRSFKDKIFLSNLIMGITIVACIVLFTALNSISVNKYKETGSTLQNLSSFYKNVNNIDTYVKDYLYTSNEKSLSKYQSYIKDSTEDIHMLEASSTSKNYYRFVLLEQMLESYTSLSEKLIASFNEADTDYTTLYNEFLRAGQLIEKTSGDYYNLITKEVNVQLGNLQDIKNSTELASIVLFGLLLFWLFQYTNKLTTSITKPINLLLDNISKIKEGQYDLSQVSGSSHEMEELCDAMNEMAYAIQNNIESTKEKAKLEKQILEWKNENLKKDELLVQSELKMLQNQINPHFLFNTLNMIYKLAIQEGAENAADILIKTSQLLRYGLDKSSKLSDIKSEVEMLKNYIMIQEIRLGERVHFELQFENESSIGMVPIPGMILQPLVENAIKHGLKNCLKEGEVEIHVSGDDKIVRISVSDNGEGMPGEDLEQFILNDYQKTTGNHMGLYNVVKRLQMYYADNGHVNINSDSDCGFEIIVEIKR